ncbi:hypothetical protein K7X08_024915 [Anisodus acutangulus]|uniref:Uncharacterized protein n=1 Tax=Anisodus acutangulus TaxID=402998 RepID=A0A9Q1MCJ1_9SOLA|nr:hypothetical protein K7X08_024915 [Anisodus acutangulus]
MFPFLIRKEARNTSTIMMSIFSSFDALSAEIFGQKMNLLKQQQQGVGPIVSESKTVATPPCAGDLNKAGEASPPPSSSQQKRPRFALEFDGVHCFETIIPY